jgi:hypothetical protein
MRPEKNITSVMMKTTIPNTALGTIGFLWGLLPTATSPVTSK